MTMQMNAEMLTGLIDTRVQVFQLPKQIIASKFNVIVAFDLDVLRYIDAEHQRKIIKTNFLKIGEKYYT